MSRTHPDTEASSGRPVRPAYRQARPAAGTRASGGPGKNGTAGVALLAGAAGLLMKNREKLTAMIRHGDSSGEAVKPVVAQAGPVASNSGPVAPAAVTDLLGSPEHPAG